MAYCTTGVYEENEYACQPLASNPEIYYTRNGTITSDMTGFNGMFFVPDLNSNTRTYRYLLYIVANNKTITYGTFNTTVDTHDYVNNFDYTDNAPYTGELPMNSGVHKSQDYQNPGGSRLYTLTTNIPIFTTLENATDYIANGDTSLAENSGDLDTRNIYSTVYIDQSVPPTIKITWNSDSEDIPDTIHLNILNTPVYGDETGTSIYNKLLAFSEGNVAFSWGGLENLTTDLKAIAIQINFLSTTDNIATVFVKKDGSYSPEEATSIDGKTTITCLRGTGDDDDGYQPPQETTDGEDTNTTTNTTGLLTRTYKCTPQQLQSLGNFLWGDDFFSNIKLLNNSPIENVVAVKAIPCSASLGSDTTIVCGNVDTQVGGKLVNKNYVKKTIGSIKVNKTYNSFVDYQHTKISLYLPLIGQITDLDPRDVMGYTITLKYSFDLITGDVMATLFNDRANGDNIMGVYRGNCGIDIPLTATNRAQVEAGYISDAITGITSIVAKNPSGVIDAGMSAVTRMNTTKSSGSVSGVTAQGLPNKAYLTVITNIPQEYSKQFRKTYGRVCMLSVKKLSQLKGFTKVSPEIDLSGISCTETERNELREILASGFYM